MGKTDEELKKMIAEAPEFCPITGMKKCDVYTIDDNVVYLPTPAYDAYTLPEYDPEEKSFSRIRYDMDDDNRVEHESLCDLDDLRCRDDFQKIKDFYKINENIRFVKITGGELFPYLKDIPIYGRVREEFDNDFVIYGCKEEDEEAFYKGILEYDFSTGIMGFESIGDVEDFWLDGGDGSLLTVEHGDFETE